MPRKRIVADADPDLEPTPPVTSIGGNAAKQLRSYVERIERLEEEKRSLSGDIKEIRAEAKGSGFDPKIITFIIALRKKDADDVAEFETQVDVYKRALGMLPA